MLFGKGLVRDEHGNTSWGYTWQRNTFGTHGGRASFVMESVRQFLDEFVNDYLRVNGPACEKGER